MSVNEDGCLVIDAPKVSDSRIITNDIAEIGKDGRHFRILGRKDNVIDSGGIKIQIEEVEALLKKYLTVPYVITKRVTINLVRLSQYSLKATILRK